ncbi:hypothetical protein SARC_02752 [Sphaeroforma arctica JP610]|uniref:Uncharacterized protein n=1 Tax=Sphaeroforma arctica JP610 TaxID=667725 RepID=A0A0L0G842_9EUKA|nr:hypothetical protein SARC_02752 [Sphaeroforma arctica JP610]KNC85059.1 hypothetical protein SARC_02752 [Sphaeroforma arctica JP610]|eukprot:XP_014158961.1 hypothetical protein SARC_02752 [Sphaeroforma arctica JP610]
MFSVKKFSQHMDHVFQDHALQVAARLSKCAEAQATLDIQQLMLCYTLDSITAIAFGERFALHMFVCIAPMVVCDLLPAKGFPKP